MKPVSVWALPDWTISWICSIGPTEFCSRLARRFDFQADSLPDNVRYVGPLLDEPGWSKAWQAPWGDRSVLPRALVTGSSGAQGQRDLVQRVINAMGTIEIDVVATTGPNLNVADLRAPKNVHL